MYIGQKIIKRAPFRWGIVGGGSTSNVGYKHRLGAMRDNTSFILTAAAFDVDAERGKQFGIDICMDPDRLYPDYKTMFEEEAKRPDGIEAVDIATPNFLHYEATKAALEAGLHVICEKPLFFEVEQGLEIKRLAEEKGKVVCVTYGFSGFDLLLQMRAMIERGDIGKVNMIDLRYAHGFGCDPTADVKAEGQKWRVDPKKVGRAFVLGDLSTHTYYMSQMICPNEKLKQVLCDRQAFVGSRYPLEDNAYCLMRYESGAVGRMWASAVNAGDHSSQTIRIVGSKASLEWNDMHPDELRYQVQGKPEQVLIRSMDYLYPEALEDERLGALHYTGLIDSWSNLYKRFAIAMDAKERGDEETLKNLVYPDIDHGIDGIKWINACADSTLIQAMIGRTMDNYFTKANGVVGEEVLKVEGLSVPGVLKDVSFNVRKGEVVGFYGLVGAGRSETMEAVFGVRPYSAGTITLKGEQVKFKGSKDAVKKGIGFVTEDRKVTGLLLPKSCRENMALAALPNIKKGLFVDEDKTYEIYAKYEKIMDIKSPSPEQPIVLLSGGNQQKVIIGKWLCMGPDLVILDEPTRGIDIGAKSEIHKLVASLAEDGLAVIVISSEMPEIMGVSNRIYTMAAGRITAELSGDEITEENLMRNIMVGA